MTNQLIQYDQRYRPSQRDIVPGGIKIRNTGNLIQSTTLSTSSATLNNGDERVFQFTVSSSPTITGTSAPLTTKVLVVPDISIFIDSVTAANQLPGGSGIDESQWIVMGGWNDWSATDNLNVVTNIYVRNVSAGAGKVVIVKYVGRVIVNAQV